MSGGISFFFLRFGDFGGDAAWVVEAMVVVL